MPSTLFKTQENRCATGTGLFEEDNARSISARSQQSDRTEGYGISPLGSNACVNSLIINHPANPAEKASVRSFNGGVQTLRDSIGSGSLPFSRHLMCKDHTPYYQPIDPTTIFSPCDSKAVCLTTVTLNDRIEFEWYYRNNVTKTWISCYNWSESIQVSGENYFAGYLSIAGYWPGINYPRAYKVDVYLDDVFSFSDYFEVTNGGINSPRMCRSVSENREPVDIKSRFTIGVDNKAYHYLKLNDIAYFNQELGCCHNFTTIWIQPNGSVYRTYQGSFGDYKDANLTWNYWKSGISVQDYLLINSSTPTGNWKVEAYIDDYYSNNTRVSYGPVSITRFVLGDTPVADWTFMVYLDADNSLENAGIDTFLKISSVGSSPGVNIVVQFDRALGQDSRYGNWTDCKRFYVTKGITPTTENATQDLGEVNMGSSDTLKDFVNWTLNHYPSNRYALVLWDHGIGCMNFCFDTTDDDALTVPEFAQALDQLPVIDMTFLDACSMGMIEIAYQIRNDADILVAPEGLGYAPGPYDLFLQRLTSNSSMSPNAFARKIVSDYIGWCDVIPDIQNATISATDLTRIGDLSADIENFASTLIEKETAYLSQLLPSHQQIILARNQTQTFQGPYAGQIGYYIDLYDFAQLCFQNTSDEELRGSAYQLMLTLENIVFSQNNKNLPDSHGLSVFFPNAQVKYEEFAVTYEKIDFAEYCSWSRFVKYHLSGNVLTINIPRAVGTITIENRTFVSDEYGIIRTFVTPGSYTINSTEVVPEDTGSREVFIQWSDNSTLNPREVLVNKSLTIEAEYESQYLLIIVGNLGKTDPPQGEYWYKASSTLEINATAPSPRLGESYVFLGWAGTGNGSCSNLDNPAHITMMEPINESAVWRHDFYLTVTCQYGSPTPTTGWFEAGKNITASVNSTINGTSGIRYVCIGWSGNGSSPVIGTSARASFIINETSSITWNWKTQYRLTLRTEPNELISPVASPLGPWYDANVTVNCTASEVRGYRFDYWIINGVKSNNSANSMLLIISEPIVATLHYSTVPAWWESLVNPLMIPIYLGLIGAVLGATLVANDRAKARIRRLVSGAKPIPTTEVLPNRVATGYRDLDNLLFGGIPENYTVVLTSPSCDERDWLVQRFLETGLKAGEPTFYITLSVGTAKSLAGRFPSNFYLFICNPQADKIIEGSPNVYKLKGVENLTEISIALAKAFRSLENTPSSPRRACLETTSDILLQHHAIQTRKWLADVTTEFKTRGFTTLAIINPEMHASEEAHAITDLFEGEIVLIERMKEQKYIKVQKMYNRKYSDCEILVKRPETREA